MLKIKEEPPHPSRFLRTPLRGRIFKKTKQKMVRQKYMTKARSATMVTGAFSFLKEFSSKTTLTGTVARTILAVRL